MTAYSILPITDVDKHGNFLGEVRGWNSPFLRLTDDRKRCYKRKRDLILRWRCNTKLVLTATGEVSRV